MKSRHGLSLIELMVAVILTGLVCWATLSLFANENTAYTRTREKVRLQSDAREAVRLVQEEIQNMGFRTAVATGSRIQSTIDTCTDVFANAASGDSSSFAYRNSTTLSGDSISFQMHELQSGSLASCVNLRTIGYRQKGSQLQRRWCNGNCTSEAWIPLLDSVVSFQVRYGISSRMPDTSGGFTRASLSNPASWTGGTLTKSGTAPNLILKGWTTTTQRALFSVAVDSLNPLQTWEISFSAQVDNAFLANHDSLSLRVGFFKTDGTVSNIADTTTFLAGTSSASSRQVVVRIAPGTSSVNGRVLGIEGKLKSTTQSGWTLTLSNIRLERVNRGILRWTESPTVAEKNKTRAVELNLLVKAQNGSREAFSGTFDSTSLGQGGLSYTPSGADLNRSFVLFKRIVPVVNNGI